MKRTAIIPALIIGLLLSLKDPAQFTYYLCAAWDKEQGAMTSLARWKVFLEQSSAHLRQPATVKFVH